MTLSEFINKANVVHNFEYDYSLVKYKNNKTKVKIICQKHGIFETRPDNHLQGVKCKSCSNKNILKTSDDFIFEAAKIHDNNYDYSLVNYKNALSKVNIICKQHGIFTQTPNKHLLGRGCPKCSINSKKDINYYIDKFNEIFNNKYIYNKDFKIIRNKISITCKIHGKFEKTITQHLSGQGCPYCNYRLNIKEFIEKSNKIHHYKYNYSLVNLVNTKKKIKIICPTHGVFETTPRQHLNGQECRLCANIKLRKKFIERISFNKKQGYQIMPNYSKKACEIFNEIMDKENIVIQHAMNGGEYYIDELGYWLDGYDITNNVVYEFDERYHFKKNILREKDIIRQNEIINHLNCKIVRIKYNDKYVEYNII